VITTALRLFHLADNGASQSWPARLKSRHGTEDADEEAAGLDGNSESDDIVIAKAHHRAVAIPSAVANLRRFYF